MDRDNIIKTGWQLLETHGIKGLTVEAVAEKIGIPLSELNRLYPEQAYLILSLIEPLHERAMINLPKFSEETVSERLFESIMAHFDEALPYKLGAGRLCNEIVWHPCLLMTLKPYALKMTKTILASAGLETSSLLGSLRARLYLGFFLYILWIWLSDNSEDQSKTMAALDQGLKKGESVGVF